MLADLRPFRTRERTGLVEDRGGHEQFANVMEKGAPADLVRLRLREAELVDDQLGKGPRALGVTSGPPVVEVESRGEREDLLGQGLLAKSVLIRHRPLTKAPNARAAEGEREPRRRTVGEHEREAKQNGKRQEATPHPLHEDERDHRGDPCRPHPAHDVQRSIPGHRPPDDHPDPSRDRQW